MVVNDYPGRGYRICHKKGTGSRCCALFLRLVPLLKKFICLPILTGTGVVDWMLKAMKQVKQRADCIAIAQQLLERGVIMPLFPDKCKQASFCDSDIMYIFTVCSN